MPEPREEMTVIERDVAFTENVNRRREFLNRVDSFIRTASAEEVTHLKKSLALRSTALGISTSTPQPKTTDRIISGVGFLIAILAYYNLRKLMIKARM